MSASTEEHLRRALGRHAGAAAATDDGWSAVVARAAAIRRRDGRRRAAAALTAAAVIIGALAVVWIDRRGDDHVTLGTPDHAEVDPDLVELSRATVTLIGAVLDEAHLSLTPRRPEALAEPRAATDRAAAAWQTASDRAGDVNPEVAKRAGTLRARLSILNQQRSMLDAATTTSEVRWQQVETMFTHLASEASEIVVGSARSAASLPVARQVADAGVVAGLAVEADRRSLPTVRPGEDGSGASESFADLALRVSPARRQAVTTIVADRRLDEAEADPSGPGARERALIARDALVDLAQAILAETPAPPPSPADPALLPRLRRDLLALHGARFGELWAVLAGDPGELAPARAAVNAAAQVAADSLTALGVELDGAVEATRAGLQVNGIRQRLDAGATTAPDAARELVEVARIEARLLVAVADATAPSPDAFATDEALVRYANDRVLSAGLALRLLPDAPAGRAGGVTRAEVQAALDDIDGDQALFDWTASAQGRVAFRVTTEGHPHVDDLTKRIAVDPPPAPRPSWTELRDETQMVVDRLPVVVTDLAGR